MGTKELLTEMFYCITIVKHKIACWHSDCFREVTKKIADLVTTTQQPHAWSHTNQWINSNKENILKNSQGMCRPSLPDYYNNWQNNCLTWNVIWSFIATCLHNIHAKAVK